MTTLFIEVAGFYIAINFKMDDYDSGQLYLKKWVEYDIEYSLQNFIIDKPGRIDHFIDIIIPKSIEINMDSEGNMYVKLFSSSKNRYTIPFQISNSQFGLVIMSAIHKLLIKNNGFMAHSSSVVINGKVYLFLGDSGAGKSTTAMLLSKKYPIVGDDRGIIRKEGKYYYFYSTPFSEKVTWVRKEKDRFPLGGFVFLKKKSFFRLDKIRNKQLIFNKVINQLIITDNAEVFTSNVFEFVNKFDNFYTLHFAKDEKKLVELMKTIE